MEKFLAEPALKYIAVFVAVIFLILLVAWIVQRFILMGGGLRGRARRIGVVEATLVDGKRRLVLVRRDEVEHLLLIGPDTDLVVESGIRRIGGRRDDEEDDEER
ncbi:MAG: hypothetical protein FJX47_06490 [Alphaproteobacteria bacterium]|nr:hypothetical protein [Alphaproteobacteria bacterium]